MTTDTKTVARWDWDYEGVYESDTGDYVALTDHERVVGELEQQVIVAEQVTVEQDREISNLRTALAASRAEVEGLKKDTERYRWLRDKANEANKSAPMVASNPLDPDISRLIHSDELDVAIDAAMEKGNV